MGHALIPNHIGADTVLRSNLFGAQRLSRFGFSTRGLTTFRTENLQGEWRPLEEHGRVWQVAAK
jgi:hypothetical protein